MIVLDCVLDFTEEYIQISPTVVGYWDYVYNNSNWDNIGFTMFRAKEEFFKYEKIFEEIHHELMMKYVLFEHYRKL